MGWWCRVRADSNCHRFMSNQHFNHCLLSILMLLVLCTVYTHNCFIRVFSCRWEDCAKVPRVNFWEVGQGYFYIPIFSPSFLLSFAKWRYGLVSLYFKQKEFLFFVPTEGMELAGCSLFQSLFFLVVYREREREREWWVGCKRLHAPNRQNLTQVFGAASGEFVARIVFSLNKNTVVLGGLSLWSCEG